GCHRSEIVLNSNRGVCLACSFFFQAEDGIRDRTVTGVQTCALPILQAIVIGALVALMTLLQVWATPAVTVLSARRQELVPAASRSEERRVGKECRSGWSREQEKRKKLIVACRREVG